MCGISGLYLAARQAPLQADARAVVAEMNRSIAHRGPDADGFWSDPRGRAFFGHRRLAIIDLSEAGRQPMHGASGRWTITFNGEIYNYEDLRREQAAKGAAFRTRTDTEVLLSILETDGAAGLARVDGMFAFAAFDALSGEMLVARDPFGEKPFYYAELPGGGFAFASELQALERVPGIDLEVSVDALAEVLMFQYVGAPRTIYRAVRKLPPGHWMRAKPDGTLETGRYFTFRPGEDGFSDAPRERLVDELDDILTRSVRRRLVADVPLGAFLSGGVDSSTTCALVRAKLGIPLKTFSIGFHDSPESEHEIARQFARHLGTEHRDDVLRPDPGGFLRTIGAVLDEPNADSSCLPTYLLSQFARRFVTVAVSGDGGDELFGGYGRYLQTIDEARGAPGMRLGHRYYGDRILIFNDAHLADLFEGIPRELAGHVGRLRGEVDAGGPPLLCRLRRTDVDHYMPGAVLPKVDRMSMQHSLEVRTPFLNVELARFAERVPPEYLCADGRGKVLLREVAYRYLPRELIDAPKRGFGLPTAEWGRQSLLRTADELLSAGDGRLRTLLGGEAIDRFLGRQRSSGGFATYQVWALAMLESWLRHHPAKLPAIGAMERTAWLPMRATTEFSIVPAARDVFFLHRNSPADAAAGDAVTSAREAYSVQNALSSLMAAMVVEPALRPSLAPVGPGEPAIAFPGFGQPLDALPEGDRARLRGATLLTGERDAFLQLDAAALAVLRDAGIRYVIGPHPHYPDAWSALKFQPTSRRDMARNAAALFRRRSAAWVRSRRHFRSGRMYATGPTTFLPAVPEREMSDRVMVFEGTRQLPPVPAGHGDIAARGGGRYSVWNGECFYSSTGFRSNGISRLNWAVDLERVDPARLQYVPAIVRASGDRTAFLARAGEALSAPVAPRVRGATRTAVVLTHALPSGGAERQWCYLAQQLRETGVTVRFLVLDSLDDGNAHYLPLLEAAGIAVDVLGADIEALVRFAIEDPSAMRLFHAKGNPAPGKLLQLHAYLRRHAPDAVYAQLDHPNVFAAIAGAQAGVPRVVISFRNYNPSRFSYLDNNWLQPAYRLVAGAPGVVMTGNSRAANADYADWIGVARERVRFIPNGLDPALAAPLEPARAVALRAELGLRAGQPLVLGVFRLSEEKDPLGFVDACCALRRDCPDLVAAVAGVGAMRAGVEARIAERGAAAFVRLLGRREDVADLMKIATLLLHASSLEGMPNAIMEAQACGLPVVATDAGGTADCVRDGETGYVVPVGDAAALVARASRLLGDTSLQAAMGAAARTWARSAFSMSRMAAGFIEAGGLAD